MSKYELDMIEQIGDTIVDDDNYGWDDEAWRDDSHISCSSCPDDECTGHCMSCSYRSF